MEYTAFQTLATITGLRRVVWDALGKSLLVEAEVTRKDGRVFPVPVSLPPEIAEELYLRLHAALAEKPLEEASRQ